MKANHSNYFFVCLLLFDHSKIFLISLFFHSITQTYLTDISLLPWQRFQNTWKTKSWLKLWRKKFQLNVEFSSANSVIATPKVRLAASLIQVVSSNINTISLVTLTSGLQTFLCLFANSQQKNLGIAEGLQIVNQVASFQSKKSSNRLTNN